MTEEEFITSLILLGFQRVKTFNPYFYTADLRHEASNLSVEITKDTYDIVRLYRITSPTTGMLIKSEKTKEALLSLVVRELQGSMS